jgi:hypothetical protein
VAELVDALASGASGGNPVEVQVLFSAPIRNILSHPPTAVYARYYERVRAAFSTLTADVRGLQRMRETAHGPYPPIKRIPINRRLATRSAVGVQFKEPMLDFQPTADYPKPPFRLPFPRTPGESKTSTNAYSVRSVETIAGADPHPNQKGKVNMETDSPNVRRLTETETTEYLRISRSRLRRRRIKKPTAEPIVAYPLHPFTDETFDTTCINSMN